MLLNIKSHCACALAAAAITLCVKAAPMDIGTDAVLPWNVRDIVAAHADQFGLGERDGLARIPYQTRDVQPQAVNGHEARADIDQIVQAVYGFEDSLEDFFQHINDASRVRHYRLVFISKAVNLGVAIRTANQQLQQPGNLTIKAIGRIIPLITNLRAAFDRATEILERNANAIANVQADYIPRCFGKPYQSLFTTFHQLLIAKTDDKSRLQFDVNTEELISDVQDLEDHFSPFQTAKDCAAAQAKADDPRSKYFDLAALFSF